MDCPLCRHTESSIFDRDKFRVYHLCSECELVFVPRDQLISETEEKKRYEFHDNSEENVGYSRYLEEVAVSIKQDLSNGESGLDFGCGPSKLLEKHLSPFQVSSYDLFFHPESQLFEKQYDFIVMSEVIEHLRDPHDELQRLSSLAPKLFVKTKTYSRESFSQWFYKRDMTHIQFFCERTFEKMAELYGFKDFKRTGEDLYLFKR